MKALVSQWNPSPSSSWRLLPESVCLQLMVLLFRGLKWICLFVHHRVSGININIRNHLTKEVLPTKTLKTPFRHSLQNGDLFTLHPRLLPFEPPSPSSHWNCRQGMNGVLISTPRKWKENLKPYSSCFDSQTALKLYICFRTQELQQQSIPFTCHIAHYIYDSISIRVPVCHLAPSAVYFTLGPIMRPIR